MGSKDYTKDYSSELMNQSSDIRSENLIKNQANKVPLIFDIYDDESVFSALSEQSENNEKLNNGEIIRLKKILNEFTPEYRR